MTTELRQLRSDNAELREDNQALLAALAAVLLAGFCSQALAGVGGDSGLAVLISQVGLFSGIGGAYSDEILHRALLSPLSRSDRTLRFRGRVPARARPTRLHPNPPHPTSNSLKSAADSVRVRRLGGGLAAEASSSVDVRAQGSKVHRARRSIADDLG